MEIRWSFVVCLIYLKCVNCAITSPNCTVTHTTATKWSVDCSNAHLRSLPPQSFLAPVYNLTLSHNQLDSSIVLNLTNLEYLDLSYNKIESVTDGIFGQVDQLEYLDLSWNQIRNLNSERLSRSMTIDLIDLSGNPLEEDVLTGLNGTLSRGMNALYLSSVGLSQIPNGFLDFAFELVTLDLSKNSIKSLPNFSSRLRYIDLSENLIETISGDPFSAATDLEELILDDNKLYIISVDAFSNCLELGKLSLKGNSKLEYLPEGLFQYNDNLNELSLENCGVKTLSQVFKPTLARIDYLDLRGNPWECSPKLKWLNSIHLQTAVKANLSCANTGESWSEYYNSDSNLHYVILILLLGLVFAVFLVGLWFAYSMEMKRRSDHPYVPLGDKNNLVNPVYVSTVV